MYLLDSEIEEAISRFIRRRAEQNAHRHDVVTHLQQSAVLQQGVNDVDLRFKSTYILRKRRLKPTLIATK